MGNTNEKADMVIQYNGKEYPCTIVDIPEIGAEMISVESLEKELLIEDGKYANDAAKAVDECVYFFVEDETFEKLMNDEEALAAYVKEQTV